MSTSYPDYPDEHSQPVHPETASYPQYPYAGYGYPQPDYPQPEAGGPAYPPPAPPDHPSGGGGGSGDSSGGTGGTRRTLAVVALVAAVVGAGVGAGTVALTGDNGGSDNTGSAGLSISTQQAPAPKSGSVSAAAARIGPSVVTIDVAGGNEQDTGSGVIIRSDGYVLTNNHVIAAASGGGSVAVTLADGRQAPGKVVGTDPSDDLAVVKIGLSKLTAATFGSSAKLIVGQPVVAVGAPLGLSDTVTSGIVSNTARPVQTSDGGSQAVFQAVQTDAAINPGNSGGPLVDLAGKVVGINAAIASDQSSGGLLVPGQQSQAGNIGIGFAIPSDEASRIAAQLIRTGKATHALMGVEVGDAASSASTSGTAATGAKVTRVTPGGPGAAAGLKAGDVIVKLDDQRIDDATALVAAVRSHAPKQRISVSYVRDGAQHTASLVLATATS